jgi:hypothetical protein
MLIAVAIVGSSRPASQTQQYPQKKEIRQSAQPDTKNGTADDRIADYTLWLERLTGLLAFSTIGLWWVTERTLRHARTDSERQADDMRASIAAASSAAEAAQKTVEKMTDTGERQLRAYVHISEGRVVFDERGTRVDFKFKNFGATPASGVHFNCCARWREYPLVSLLEDAPAPRDYGRAVLAPGGPPHAIIIHRNEWLNGINQQPPEMQRTLYIYGTIYYVDAFNHPRETHFRYIMMNTHGHVGVCEEGNYCT